LDGLLQLLLTGAAIAGLLGGVHCAAMCGGIVAAVCGTGGGDMPWRKTYAYNFGRIASYVAAGAIVGGLGQAGLAWRGDAMLRQALMMGAGIALILLALFMAGWSPLVRVMEAAGARLWRYLQPWTRRFLPVNTIPRALGLGALWGWLPCGMVYAVLLTAASTGDARDGALVMAAFGLGTLPNLLAVAVFAHRLQRYTGIRGVRIAGALAVAAFGMYAVMNALQPHALHALVSCFTSDSAIGTRMH
jgi:sulfite exporter TauE/SafE